MTNETPAEATLLDLATLLPILSSRKRDTHKGHYGHVLVIGGNRGMSGAVRLAGEAAARVGAGLVSIGTNKQHAALISVMRPELMSHAVESVDDLAKLVAKASVLVIGPGLGQDEWAQQLLAQALVATQLKVVDADGLNLLANNPSQRHDWLLTPHPGEAARLLNCTTAEIQADRFAAVIELKRRYGGVVVLKGTGTLIACGEKVGMCPFGNPGMASGGMGDVLSGVLGGLIAQGIDLETAAQLGVLLHSKAADHVAQTQGERGMLALDLMPELQKLVNT
jgi:NAD(P)H-hydrate epimerase